MRKMTIPLAALLAVSCQTTTGPDAPAPLERLPRDLTAQEQRMLQASNRFAFDILRETVARETKPNVFLSPLSASLALGMTATGAAGSTLDEMRAALGFDDASLEEMNRAHQSLTELLLGLDRRIDMRIANSIWSRQGFPFNDSFYDAARRWYSAEVATLDFNSSDAARTINRWVDRSTNGRISEIVDDPIDADAVMFLINAVYFNGQWREKFDRAHTAPGPFTLATGSVKQVQMMRRTGAARVAYAQDGTQVLEQLYGRGAFAMTIVLPPADRRVDDVIATLDEAQWNAWTGALRDADEVGITMPKYRIAYETTMNAALRALGMECAFVPHCPDFTPMSPEGEDLYIHQVKQKTWVDVHEEGTEAAAVTSVEIRVVSAPPQITVDRPFIVVLRERFSGAILFIGRIGDPSAQQE